MVCRGREFAFDDAAMVANDLGHQCKPQAAPRRLGADEGIEQMRHEVGGNARAVVLHGNLERQAHPCLAAGDRKADAWTERCGQRDLPVGAVLADGFGSIFDEIEKHLDQLVAAGRHRRQRGVVMLHDLDVPREAVDGDLLNVVEHVVDVDRLALQRPLVAEDLHAVDELADAV